MGLESGAEGSRFQVICTTLRDWGFTCVWKTYLHKFTFGCADSPGDIIFTHYPFPDSETLSAKALQGVYKSFPQDVDVSIFFGCCFGKVQTFKNHWQDRLVRLLNPRPYIINPKQSSANPNP